MLNLEPDKTKSGSTNSRRKFHLSGSVLPKAILAISFAFLLFLGSTFAANINLNNNQSVEFGQGVAQATACDDEVTLTPYSSFVNESGGGSFKFTSIAVTGIGEECDGRVFTIKAYKNGEDNPLPLYVVGGSPYDQIKVADTAGTFSLVDSDLGSESLFPLTDQNGFEVYFQGFANVAATDADDVDRITIESNVGSGESPSPSPSPSPSGDLMPIASTYDCNQSPPLDDTRSFIYVTAQQLPVTYSFENCFFYRTTGLAQETNPLCTDDVYEGCGPGYQQFGSPAATQEIVVSGSGRIVIYSPWGGGSYDWTFILGT